MATEFCSMTIYVREQQTNQFMANTIDDVVEEKKSRASQAFWEFNFESGF